ncbi:MAG: amidohydrolase family protein, partial [Atribacterota bacterium]
LTDTAVYVLNDKIVEIDDFEKLKNKYPEAVVKGNGKQLLMPGLIDSHSHGAGLTPFQRGIHYDFLENYLIDSPSGITLEPELNGIMCGLRHLRNGCTTLHCINNHMNLSSAKKLIEGFQKVGIRFAYSTGLNDLNRITYDDRSFYETLPVDLQKKVYPIIFDDKKAFQEKYFHHFDDLYHQYNNENNRIIFGPLWAQGCSDEFLKRIKEKADKLFKTPVHIHTLQTPIQKAYGLHKYNKSLLAHLNDIGLVDDNTVLGHAVYLNESDIKLLAKKNGSVTHHASCNLVVRNGISPVYYFQKAGINVALGIDDKSVNDDEDPFMEMRMIYHLHRVPGFDLEKLPSLSSTEVLKMATQNGARVCNFKDSVGVLKPGMKADLILVDLERIMENPWVSPDINIFDLIICRAKGTDTNLVMVNGKIIIEDHKFCHIDLDAVYDEVREQTKRGIDLKQKEYADILQQLKPYIRSFYQSWQIPDLVPFYEMNSRI